MSVSDLLDSGNNVVKFEKIISDLIVRNLMWVSCPMNLNDGIEFTFNIINCDMESKVLIKNKLEHMGVICLTNSHKNELMWSHYANGGRGICIQFSVPFDDLNKTVIEVRYKKCRTSIKYEDLTAMKGRKFSESFVYTKGDNWKYEKEYRIIVPVGNRLTKINYRVKSIIFGYRINESIVEMVKKLSSDKGIALYRAVILDYNDIRCFKCN